MLAREAKIPMTYKGLSEEGIDFINKVKLILILDDPETCEEKTGL